MRYPQKRWDCRKPILKQPPHWPSSGIPSDDNLQLAIAGSGVADGFMGCFLPKGQPLGDWDTMGTTCLILVLQMGPGLFLYHV